jgi:hypothetical protein
MNKIALVLAVIMLFCGYHVNAQMFSGSNLLLGGLALGALGGLIYKYCSCVEMIKGSCTTTIKKKTYKIKVFIVVILNLGLLSTDTPTFY